jgi:hypothetical protein
MAQDPAALNRRCRIHLLDSGQIGQKARAVRRKYCGCGRSPTQSRLIFRSA